MNRIALGGTGLLLAVQQLSKKFYSGIGGVGDHFVSLVGARRFVADSSFSFDDDALLFC